jgi:translocation and assembly module TamB
VQYGVGINTPVNTLTFRYRLTQRIFIEALSGLENALDILYSFELE